MNPRALSVIIYEYKGASRLFSIFSQLDDFECFCGARQLALSDFQVGQQLILKWMVHKLGCHADSVQCEIHHTSPIIGIDEESYPQSFQALTQPTNRKLGVSCINGHAYILSVDLNGLWIDSQFIQVENEPSFKSITQPIKQSDRVRLHFNELVRIHECLHANQIYCPLIQNVDIFLSTTGRNNLIEQLVSLFPTGSVILIK